MSDSPKSFIIVAYIPCTTCGEACVVVERFPEAPSDEFLDRYPFQATCDNCDQTQVRVGRDAFRRTMVEWELQPVGTGRK